VPAVAPDTVPAWFGHDTSYSSVFLKHIIAVRFDSTAPVPTVGVPSNRCAAEWWEAGASREVAKVSTRCRLQMPVMRGG